MSPPERSAGGDGGTPDDDGTVDDDGGTPDDDGTVDDDGTPDDGGTAAEDGTVGEELAAAEGALAPGAAELDPVTLEVLRNALAAAAEEMNATLVRTAYSPNVTERRDCSCAVFAADGSLVSQAENIPVHLGAMPAAVRAALDAHPPGTLAPGDAVLLNDPFAGGAHLPDVTLVAPVFPPDVDGTDAELPDDTGDAEPLAFVANRAHHADVGGARAGGFDATASEIYAEGLRIPPIKLDAGGEPVPGVRELLFANVRTPDERRGDLRAQSAANETGRRRLRELAERHGTAELRGAFEAVQAYAERRTRAAIDELPDGSARFEDVLDGDGQGATDLPIVATVTVDGDAVTVDFAGSAPRVDGPINAVRAVTESATYYAVRVMTDPAVPPNGGCYRPITVETPADSIVDAELPAAVVGGNVETSQRVTDAVLGAFGELAPDRGLAASQGTMNNVTFGGTDPRAGTPYAFYETQGGGAGASAARGGMDAVHVHMSNTRNTPAEVLESSYPLRVLRYALRPDSGGAGERRGGLGLRRDVLVRGHDAAFSLLAERHRHAPYGLAGGDDGARGAAWLFDDADDVPASLPVDGDPDGSTDARVAGPSGGERLPAKTSRTLPAGSVLSLHTPGGGGYGEPARRDPAAIARDLRLGLATPAAVQEAYPAVLPRVVEELFRQAGDDPSGAATAALEAFTGPGGAGGPPGPRFE